MTNKQYEKLISKINELRELLEDYDAKIFRFKDHTLKITKFNYHFIEHKTGQPVDDKKSLLAYYSRKVITKFLNMHLEMLWKIKDEKQIIQFPKY